MSDNKAVDEYKPSEPEIRGGDKPSDYIADAPLPQIPSARPLRADAHEAEDDLDDEEE